MTRREFLTTAGSLAGYTLMVRLPAGADQGATASREAIAHRLDTMSPQGTTTRRLAGEPHLALVDLAADVLVAGGGMAGVCAALAAARNGARVVLVQDRSRLGGNASSEVKMHIVGADCHGGRPGWREGGLLEELRLDDAVNNPQRSFELWDLLLYDKVMSEPNITLLLDTTLYAAQTKAGRIQRVLARCDKTEHLYRIKASVYIDCTGDSRLALEAGAQTRWGREARSEFNESLAPLSGDQQTLGSSILFTARDYGRPMPYRPPPWARKVTQEQLRFRGVASWEYGYWWIEWGGQLNTIRDQERIRFELLAIVAGVWDYIKNSGNHPTSANWAMDWIGFLPGKRESRRIVGDYVLTQHDIQGETGEPYDAVAIGGWPMDDHPPEGFDRPDEKPATQVKPYDAYSIPLRCLYSRNVANLMMAGRNISASHVAFSSTRVMGTCSVIGQAAGTAAALCAKYHLTPRQLCQDTARLNQLQQNLLRDDQTIKGLRNTDPADLARLASVTASDEFLPSKAANVINGLVRDLGNEWNNRWAAPLGPAGAWLELAWRQPQRISRLQLTFDTGFHRELTLSAQNSVNAKVIRAPQPETVRDYKVTYLAPGATEPTLLLQVTGNYQRLNRHEFPAIIAKSLRIHITASNGDPLARLYEVRCYP